MPAVSNSSPLILFGRLDRLDLLRQVFSEIIIPGAVREEVLTSAASLPGAIAVSRATWIRVQGIEGGVATDDPVLRLGRGEREAILLTEQLGGHLAVVLDDLPARRLARGRGLQVYGSAGVLVLAKEMGAIRAVRPELDRLLTAGLYLSEQIYHEALAVAGEDAGADT